MDCPVKPGNDYVDNCEQEGLTLAISLAISTPPGTSGLLAFGWESAMTGSTRSSDGLDDRRKRLLFRCWHRGTREMDLILGRFADAEIAGLADEELSQLEHLITMSRRPRLELRVIPFSVGANPGLKGPALIMEFNDQPTLVHVEVRGATGLLEESGVVRDVRVAWKELHDIALPLEDSARLIAEITGTFT